MKTSILKFLLIVIALALSTSIIKAQDSDDIKNSTPEQRAEVITNWMESELKLDSTVIGAVYDINLNYARKNQMVMNSGDRKLEKYKQLKSASEAKDKELQKIFSKEQFKDYLQKKEEMKKKVKQKLQERKKS